MATNDIKLTWPVYSSKRESIVFIQWCECYACCDWSLPMIYFEYSYMDDVTENLFSLFRTTWRAVLKRFVRLFRIKQVKASKEVWHELFTKKGKREKRRQKQFLTTWDRLAHKSSFWARSATVSAKRDRTSAERERASAKRERAKVPHHTRPENYHTRPENQANDFEKV